MATCYICGRQDSHYRRTVSTGYSIGSWISKRSYGAGRRNYYGKRTVCKSCAENIDKWNNIKLVAFLLVVLAIILFSIGKSNSNNTGTNGIVIAETGLNLREEASSSSNILNTIPYNTGIEIIDTGTKETISGQTANWYRIKYKGKIGWAWGGFIKDER